MFETFIKNNLKKLKENHMLQNHKKILNNSMSNKLECKQKITEIYERVSAIYNILEATIPSSLFSKEYKKKSLLL